MERIYVSIFPVGGQEELPNESYTKCVAVSIRVVSYLGVVIGPDHTKQFAAIRNQINDLDEKDRSRQMWLSLISPYEKLKSLRAKGVMIGKKAFATARKHAKKTGAGLPVAKPQTLTIPTPEEAKEAIRLHLVDTFDKFTPNYFKKACRKTDMCEICHEGKKAQSILNVQENRLSAAETKRLKDCVQTYEEHRQHKTDRQKHMKERIQNLRNGEIVILSDFKENISLMKGVPLVVIKCVLCLPNVILLDGE
ncbi:hypothetical protein PROFUN_12134 [Planoprotostelium fungivorum]|uniref:Uncharacterized protein n=1 Tax=Planoprotostelium fungivorum TaxID=1890364 RepID=A0A2P6N883_9EUKA|nr:hypothetical protein PROFUN_12134 [Planoprotostelium fungivorum]